MPNIVFQIVPTVLQHLGMLVLYLPPRPPTVRKHFHVLRPDLCVRYPTVVERPLLRLFYLPFPVLRRIGVLSGQVILIRLFPHFTPA